METLELFYDRFLNEWHLRDTRGNHIGTLMARADAEKYATEMGYKLRIYASGDIRTSPEWFTPPAMSATNSIETEVCVVSFCEDRGARKCELIRRRNANQITAMEFGPSATKRGKPNDAPRNRS